MLGTGVDVADVRVGEQRADIRRILVARRREVLSEIQRRVRSVREEGAGARHHATPLADTVEAEPEDDLPFALIQMKTETLQRINEAVRHLDEGAYGYCVDCGDVIAPSRLRAVPFAVRCRDCQALHEREQQRHRLHVQRVTSGLGARH
jgi:DnaK suppressor protein